MEFVICFLLLVVSALLATGRTFKIEVKHTFDKPIDVPVVEHEDTSQEVTRTIQEMMGVMYDE